MRLILWLVNRLVPELLFHVNHILLVLYEKIMALSVEKDAAQRGDKDDSQSVPHPLWFPSLRQVKKVKTGWLKMCYHVKVPAGKGPPGCYVLFLFLLLARSLFFFFLNDQPVLIRLYYCFGQSDAHQTEGADPNPSLPFQHNPVRSQGQQLSRGNSMA